MMNQGVIEEIVESSREAGSVEASAGISRILTLQFGGSIEEEDQEEQVRRIDDVGKFAVIFKMLEDNDDINELQEITGGRRAELGEGNYILGKGNVLDSPIENLNDVFGEFMPYLDMFQQAGVGELDVDSGHDLPDEVGFDFIGDFLDQLTTTDPIYRLIREEGDAHLVFNLSEENFQVDDPDFPSQYTTYNVLGRVEHVYSEREEEMLIDILDMMPSSGQESRVERRQLLSSFADAATDVLGRDVSVDEFSISYPDIRIRPMAIYLY